MRPHKPGCSALFAESEILELHEGYDRVIIVCLDEVDVVRSCVRLLIECVAVLQPATAQLYGVLRKRVVSLDDSPYAGISKPQVGGLFLAQDEKSLTSCARHHAVEQVQGFDDRTRSQVVLQREGGAQQCYRVSAAVLPLCNTKPAEVFPANAKTFHVGSSNEREHGVRASAAIRPDAFH